MNVSKHILIVDDEKFNRELLESMIVPLGYSCEKAVDGHEALSKLSKEIDLIILDVTMPGMDGFEVVRRVRSHPDYHNIPIIMATALSSSSDRMAAVNAGANDYIVKPIDQIDLRMRTLCLLKMKEAQDAVQRHRMELEEIVESRTAELSQAIEYMAGAQSATLAAHLDTIHRLAMAAESRDQNTAAHIHRVSQYSGLLARSLRLPAFEVDTILHASIMHDVGKIGVPDAILLKAGKLTEEEWAVMKQHTIIGARILRGSPSHLLQAGEVIALAHHEKWDGSGYPYQIAGEDIPLMARICTVADVFDALTTHRVYKPAMSNDQAIQIMRDGRGSHFDPDLLDRFFAHLKQVEKIQDQYRDDMKELTSLEMVR